MDEQKLREELNKAQTNTADVTITPKAPETSESANDVTNTGGPPTAKSDDDTEEGHSHRDVLEDDLNEKLWPPTLVGVLPWLWLPVKRVPSDEDATPGFFHHRRRKSSTRFTYSRNCRFKNKISNKRAIRDPNNPNKIYYHHPERRRSTLVSPIIPTTSGGPSNMFNDRSVRMSSPERSEIRSRDIPIYSRGIPSTSTDPTPREIPGSEILPVRFNRKLTNKFGKLARSNFE
ncbi:11063_t:CDS:2 [Funneliformis mosseae]|uniref:11063_t:CDS:1 n=1 Tax=Funneliformis mosseae TaxID=27381 RepID=A0A9N9B734_FUNMO|nr:11063_t:CDS:2 [Funneliformis mosseae]